ncbi:hypothetical protein Q4603_18450 [Zobellia galactanivorans]|uniref:hypothetical protein n=1 Tax=Zobellia galactanivorans (strain DSM 12802 / CCUG 47099 / CIP 106680 / NCIMB 13871 / Dsij) TaxID=63186 RepID=UPI0026E1B8FA|nr:hypothetical protein [Zobellia galactanivorans]MDO6810610.1 hypothetical protein [Zobellia galactanivorans]
MKAKQTYLKGKSVFKVSLIVIGVTILTVYLTGENYHRTLTENFYLSLGIISTTLFLFMAYGLYQGVGLLDNFPKIENYKAKTPIFNSGNMPPTPDISVGDGIGGLLLSILLWIGITIILTVLLVLFEAVLWLSIFIILAMLYWVFFRALKFVFNKSADTKGDLGISALYALGYTSLYVGWIFGLVFIVDALG